MWFRFKFMVFMAKLNILLQFFEIRTVFPEIDFEKVVRIHNGKTWCIVTNGDGKLTGIQISPVRYAERAIKHDLSIADIISQDVEDIRTTLIESSWKTYRF